MLKDKIILVTGGSGLLGAQIMHDLKQKGARAINLDINVANNLDEGTCTCDITDTSSIIATLDIIIKHFGRIDGLVNNAYPRTKDFASRVEDVTDESWRLNVDMQLNSYFFMSREVLKIMANQGFGSIVNMTSIYGVVGNDPTIYENTEMKTPPAYTAIKGGLINLTRYLAAYYGPKQVRINCVSPGGIFDHQPAPFVTAYEKRVPMKRMGTPKDIAPVVSFLLSDEAGYVTGQNICVDGGWTAI